MRGWGSAGVHSSLLDSCLAQGCGWQRSLCRGQISRILIEGDCEGLGKGWGTLDAGQRVNTVNPNGDSVLTVLQSIRAEIWAMGRQA